MNASLQLAIEMYTAGVTRARDEYRSHPFAATHVRRCAGDCGGWICTTNQSDYCRPCGWARPRDAVDAVGVKPCGTDAAYHRHIKNRETPCEACKQAHLVETRDARQATTKALTQLRANHLDEFRALYVAALGYEPRRGRPPRKDSA